MSGRPVPSATLQLESVGKCFGPITAVDGIDLVIERGEFLRTDNPMKSAPHTAAAVASDSWTHSYSRERAAFPAPWLKEHKFWPVVARIDNVYGDRNLFCSCPPVEFFEQALETSQVSLEAAIAPQPVS